MLVAYAGAQFFAGPVLGNLGDRFGRRPILLFSAIAFALDYLLMAAAPTLAWLFVGRLIAGIAGADLRAGQCGARRRHRAGEARRDLRADGRRVRPRLHPRAGDRRADRRASARARRSSSRRRSPPPTPCGSRRACPRRCRRAAPAVPLARRAYLRRLPAALPRRRARRRCWSPPCSGSSAISSIRRPGPSGPGSRCTGTRPTIGWSLAAAGLAMALAQVFVTGRAIARFGEARTVVIGMVVGGLELPALRLRDARAGRSMRSSSSARCRAWSGPR